MNFVSNTILTDNTLISLSESFGKSCLSSCLRLVKSVHLKPSEVLFNSRLAETAGPAHAGRHEGKITVIYKSCKCGLPTMAVFVHQQRLLYWSWRYFVTLLFGMLKRVLKEHNDPSQITGSLVTPCHYVCTLKHEDESSLSWNAAPHTQACSEASFSWKEKRGKRRGERSDAFQREGTAGWPLAGQQPVRMPACSGCVLRLSHSDIHIPSEKWN